MIGTEVEQWTTTHIEAKSFAATDVSRVLREAAEWVADAYEGDSPIYDLLSVSLHKDEEYYVLMVVYE